MPAPVLSSFAQRLYSSVAPLAYDDANNQYALANYCAALGKMFQIVDDYGRDQFVGAKLAPGWSQLVDINRAPPEALSWLAQFVGVKTLGSLSDANQRARIRGVGGWNRGTPASIVAAAQQFLTGTKAVILRERDATACAAQPAYGLTVITRETETPLTEWPTTNLLPDQQSFEEGVATNWSNNGTLTSTSIVQIPDAPHGSFAYQGQVSGVAANNGYIYRYITGFNPGDVASLSGSFWTDAPSATCYCQVQFVNNAFTVLGTVNGVSVAMTPNQWFRAVLDGAVAPAGTTQALCVFTVVTSTASGNYARYDALQLEKKNRATPFVIGSRVAGAGNVLAALLEQKPAGIILNYQVIAGEDYQILLTAHPLYSNVFADFATYQGVATATPGT